MSKKQSSSKPSVTPPEIPIEDLPDFAFIGTDGQYYQIGKTPHEFVMLLKRMGVNPNEFTLETLNHWIWLHVRCVSGQHHLTPEDVERLYFHCDIPSIVDAIFRRLAHAKTSTAEMVGVMSERFNQLVEPVPRAE